MNETEGRIHHWIRTLKDDLYTPCEELSWEAFHTYEHMTPAEASEGPFKKVRPGYAWGHKWEYGWFRTSFTVPEEAKGQRIVLRLAPGGESTLFVNGAAFGTYRADWVTEAHHYYEDNFLCTDAVPGTVYDILMETYAGHYYPQAPDTNMCATGPVLPGSYEDPAEEGKRRILGTCTWGIWNETAYQLLMDVMTLDSLLTVLDKKSLRAAKVSEALRKFTLTVDFEQDRRARTASYEEARELLKPVLSAKNGSTAPDFCCIGNAHLDLSWLWPIEETHRKTARTFAAQLRLLKEYPEYLFIQSQPASYEMCREYYPELFERIKKAVGEGRWIADGVMWVEPDTNMAGGEALIRQLLYGKKYYKEVFGLDSRVLWLPDTFGYSAALPQILKGCGVLYLVTQKIFWSYNESERFPYHYFSWRGMDGTEVTSFLPTSYTYKTDPAELCNIWNGRAQTDGLDSFLVPFGYGDGGGGPSRDHIEFAMREKDLEGVPRVKMMSPLQFFEKMEKPLNTYTGELYFSAHRGTYTSQAAVKKGNRQCELKLREAEFWSAFAGTGDLKTSEKLWKELLLHQFHDILPGSSIGRVYEETENAHRKILSGAEKLLSDAAGKLTAPRADAVSVGNSLSFSRKELVPLPERFKKGVRTGDGCPVPAEITADGVQALLTLPPCGILTVYPAECDAAAEAPAVRLWKENGTYIFENSRVRITLNERAEVTGYVLKESGREFAASPMNVFRIYKDVPRYFDAWDIDSNYIEQELPGAYGISADIQKESGLDAVLTVSGRIGNSSYSQSVRLTAGSTVLTFDTCISWCELHRLLKVAFPVNVCAENGINEIQFGFIERPAHRSRLYDKDRFEVCNHRYSALCEGSHGAAVLNDCKYGISMNGNSLELTLLRAPASPEMRADNRIHTFRYGFTAWEGSFTDSPAVREGYAFNVPPAVWEGKGIGGSRVIIDAPQVFLDTAKAAEDGSGDIILRFYEAKKTSVTARVTLMDKNVRVYLCDMLENVIKEIPAENGSFTLQFTPFKIQTVRYEKRQ